MILEIALRMPACIVIFNIALSMVFCTVGIGIS
jgi:hypothetical protein